MFESCKILFLFFSYFFSFLFIHLVFLFDPFSFLLLFLTATKTTTAMVSTATTTTVMPFSCRPPFNVNVAWKIYGVLYVCVCMHRKNKYHWTVKIKCLYYYSLLLLSLLPTVQFTFYMPLSPFWKFNCIALLYPIVLIVLSLDKPPFHHLRKLLITVFAICFLLFVFHCHLFHIKFP